jgi:hypothetical protein
LTADSLSQSLHAISVASETLVTSVVNLLSVMNFFFVNLRALRDFVLGFAFSFGFRLSDFGFH